MTLQKFLRIANARVCFFYFLNNCGISLDFFIDVLKVFEAFGVVYLRIKMSQFLDEVKVDGHNFSTGERKTHLEGSFGMCFIV